MHSYSALQLCIAVRLALTGSAYATPQVAFPINSQVPPVAYVSQTFDFTFSPNTFTSSGSPISYALKNQPIWLSIDGDARRLRGTPTSSDVGAAKFELVASDTNGQTLSDVTLVILDEQTLFVRDGQIALQLANAGRVSAPSSLLLYPQQAFEFTLASNLFDGTSVNTVFYAVSSDGTPLPSWIQFDPATRRFSGMTPPLLGTSSSQQVYGFEFGASNVVGFLEAGIRFDIHIGNQLLAFSQPIYNFTGARRLPLQIPSLLNRLTINGNATARGEITSANIDAPTWLQFNATDLSLSGVVPMDAQSLEFSLTVNSLNTNAANATIVVQIATDQNGTQLSLGNITATTGAYFTYIIRIPSGFAGNTRTIVKDSDLPSWLAFTTSNNTLHGLVPKDATPEVRFIAFTFNSGFRSVVANLSLAISQSPNPSSNLGSSSTTSNAPPTSSLQSASRDSDNRTTTLVLATVLPVLAAVFLICVLLVCLRKRRAQQKRLSKPAKQQITKQPSMQEIKSHIRSKSIAANAGEPPAQISNALRPVPRIEITYAPDLFENSPYRIAKRRKFSQNSISGSGWDDLIDDGHSSDDSLPRRRFSFFKSRKDSEVEILSRRKSSFFGRRKSSTMLPPPEQFSSRRRKSSAKLPPTQELSPEWKPPERVPPQRPARPDSLIMRRLSQMSHFARSTSPIATQTTGLPERLGGAGHGAGGTPGVHPLNPRSSWQTTAGTLPVVESRPSVVVMNAFPAPPARSSMDTIASGPQRSTYEPRPRSSKQSFDLPESSGIARYGHNDAASKGPYGSNNKGLRNLQNVPPISMRSGKIAELPAWTAEDYEDEAQNAYIQAGSYKAPQMPSKSQSRSPHGKGRAVGRDSTGTEWRSIKPVRTMSTASSRQFDSAVSSDSQWEDDRALSDGISAKESFWHTDAEPHPPLPTDPRHQPVRIVYGQATTSASNGPRLADQRRQPSVGDTGLERSDRSYQGSFRFI